VVGERARELADAVVGGQVAGVFPLHLLAERGDLALDDVRHRVGQEPRRAAGGHGGERPLVGWGRVGAAAGAREHDRQDEGEQEREHEQAGRLHGTGLLIEREGPRP
jgi:hypothetical protein